MSQYVQGNLPGSSVRACEQERIKSPAIRIGDKIVEGEHHFAVFECSREVGLLGGDVDYDDLFLDDLGFTTTRGRYVSRKVAFRIARAAGQIHVAPRVRQCELATEDVLAAD